MRTLEKISWMNSGKLSRLGTKTASSCLFSIQTLQTERHSFGQIEQSFREGLLAQIELSHVEF